MSNNHPIAFSDKINKPSYSVIENRNTDYWITLLLSIMTVFSLFCWQGHKGFNLADEGFLWYGVQRVLVGEVPLRDFMAYDPGRYYWSASLMYLLGSNGIMPLRLTVAIFQIVGLWMGLLAIARTMTRLTKENFLFLLLTTVTLVLWMFPRHKLFDISLSLLLITTLTLLIKQPSTRQYLITGIGIGLVAVFGRNHGLYGLIGSLGVMAWLNLKRATPVKVKTGFFWWATGITVGFSPILLMLLLVPGYFSAFWDSLYFLIEQKTTNIPLPIPWPWTINFSSLPLGDALRGWLVGLFFIGSLLFGLLGIAWVIWQKLKQQPVPPVCIASIFLALPYAHFALSRADVGHLAQGIFPLLVGSLAFLSTCEAKIKWPLAAILSGTSLWIMPVFHPGWQCHTSHQWVTVDISGSTLQVDPGTVNDIALLRQLANQYAPHGEAFIVTPFWPGAYPLLERRSPLWEIYALFPRGKAFEKTEITRIKAAKPNFAVILNLPLDGREELRFCNTHPLIHRYILHHFEPLDDYHYNPMYQLYRRKSTSP